MTPQQKDILKNSVEIKEEDFERANRIREIMEMPGWHDLKHLYAQVHAAIWDLVKKSKKDDVYWKYVGIMDGHDLTVDYPSRWVNLVESKRFEQDLETKKLDLSEIDKLLGVQ